LYLYLTTIILLFSSQPTAPPQIYTLSLHDALPISSGSSRCAARSSKYPRSSRASCAARLLRTNAIGPTKRATTRRPCAIEASVSGTGRLPLSEAERDGAGSGVAAGGGVYAWTWTATGSAGIGPGGADKGGGDCGRIGTG